MNSPPTGRKKISRAAAEEIGERVFNARFRILEDLAAVAVDRGTLTGPQLGAVASLLVAMRGDQEDVDRRVVLAEWLAENELAFELAARVPDAPGFPLASDALRALFGVTDEEAERLGLRQLVSERLRSRARRREEGVPPRQVGVAGQSPWEAAGVSRATWFRRQKASQDATAPGETPATLLKEKETRAHAIGSFESHDLPVLDVASLRSAEERRYARQALALGAIPRFEADFADPWTWFDLPPGLSDIERTAVQIVCEDAVAARRRREAVATARARRMPPPPPHDPQDCPARVSPAVWEEVPPELREDTALRAGRLFLAGAAPDDAIRAGLAAALAAQGEIRPEERTPLRTGPSPDAIGRARAMAARVARPPYPETYAEHAITALAEALERPENRGTAPLLLVETARNAGYDRSRLKPRAGVQAEPEPSTPDLGDTAESVGRGNRDR